MTTTENSHTDPTEALPVADAQQPETDTAAGVDAPASHEPAVTADEDAETAAAPVEHPQPVPDTADAADASSVAPAPAAERPAPVADEVLLSSVEVARAALLEVTPAETVGEPVGHVAEDDHVLSLFFDSKLRGYPGWHWTVTLSRVGDDGEVTVLETELMPGENALLAPEWVPWSERLADYQAGQEVAESEARALAEAAAILDDSDDDDDDDEDVFSILHAGDVDGVDVDEIDEDSVDDDDEDDVSVDDDDDDDEDDVSDGDESDDEGSERSY